MTRTVDGTWLYDNAITRIHQLEQLNATLSAEIDRMRPVVEAGQVLVRSIRRHDPASWSGTEEALERTVTDNEVNNGR